MQWVWVWLWVVDGTSCGVSARVLVRGVQLSESRLID